MQRLFAVLMSCPLEVGNGIVGTIVGSDGAHIDSIVVESVGLVSRRSGCLQMSAHPPMFGQSTLHLP